MIFLKISEAFDRYCTDFIAMRNQSPKTAYNHRTAINMFIAMVGDLELSSITFEVIRDWKKELDKSRGSRTVAGYIISLRVLLRWLMEKGYEVLDYNTIPVPITAPSIPKYISPEEVSQLIVATGMPMRGYAKINRVRNQLLISFLYSSGLRVHELCSLNRGQIRDRSFTVLGKRRQPRLCFIDERTEILMNDYLKLRTDDNEALFINNQSKGRLTPHTINKILARTSTVAGVKPIHAHTLRHSYATNLLKNNCNMRYVQTLMGHKSLQTTQIYTHVTDSDLQAIYEAHHTT